LMGQVSALPQLLASMPNAWVYEVPSSTLRAWYLRYPLRQGWDVKQRESVLAQLERNVIENIRLDAPGDREWYRRLYVGLLVACGLTQDALAQVKGTRVQDERDCNLPKPQKTVSLNDGGSLSFE
jgi:hypothetical protein